jgi:hypothetical protein
VDWSFTDAGVDTFGPTLSYNWIAPAKLDLKTVSNGDIAYWDIIAEGSYSGPGGQLILSIGYGGPVSSVHVDAASSVPETPTTPRAAPGRRHWIVWVAVATSATAIVVWLVHRHPAGNPVEFNCTPAAPHCIG